MGAATNNLVTHIITELSKPGDDFVRLEAMRFDAAPPACQFRTFAHVRANHLLRLGQCLAEIRDADVNAGGGRHEVNQPAAVSKVGEADLVQLSLKIEQPFQAVEIAAPGDLVLDGYREILALEVNWSPLPNTFSILSLVTWTWPSITVTRDPLTPLLTLKTVPVTATLQSRAATNR